MSKPQEYAKTAIPIAIIVMLAYIVIASGSAPYFTPIPPSVINCYQNSTCFYDFNATDTEGDTLNFSINKPPFSDNINPNNGILNFTPTNDEVGDYNFTWAIVQEIDTGNGTFAIITWHIININDPPNITGYSPENLTNTTLKENSWTDFNVSAYDIDFKHGDHINFTWTLNGTVNRNLLNWTENGTTSWANYTPDFVSAGIHNITVKVTDNMSSWVSVSWTVNVTNENRLIIFNETNPVPNITLPEDTWSYNVYNLDDFFYDLDLDDYPLSYDFIYVSGSNLNILINATEPNNVSLVGNLNYFGTNKIQFRAYDGYNYTFSNNVTVNVTPFPDPPNITQVTDQLAYADTLWQLQIQAADPDNIPPSSGLTYYDNTTLFNINPTTGFISATFSTAVIGNYTIRINVSDGLFNTSMDFNLTIINNSAPVLGGKPLPDIYTQEGNLTVIWFNATDEDLTDTLLFSVQTDKTPNPEDLTPLTLNNSPTNASARIQFMPDQTDVGTWTVNIYVNDTKGAYDLDTFTIFVLDIQHTPVLRPIANQRMKINRTFSMTVFADDEDGDITGFAENTSLFDITPGGNGFNATGGVSFTPNDTDFGEHWVNITVLDSTGRQDTKVVLFNVTYNTPPSIYPIPNQTGQEDHLFTFQVNASDPDPQDTLVYYSNSSIFNISNTTGLISFTPDYPQVGYHIINITVGDGEANVSTLMLLNITEYDDPPIWIPSLNRYFTNQTNYLNTSVWNSTNILNYTTNRTIWNSSMWQGNYTQIYMDAYDEETATLVFSLQYINFTNESNDTVTSGISLINLSSYDGDTALAVLNPNNSQVGTYYLNFTVQDNASQKNGTVVKLTVFNVNDPPIVINHTPEVTYYQNMTENSSMMFNVTAIDLDYGDHIRYQWALNNTNISGANKSYYNYTTTFFSAGWRNLTVYMTDDSNATTAFSWAINVSNVNRMGWFGQIREYNRTHWLPGPTQSNITILNESIILFWNGTAYRPSGMFESQILDSRETNIGQDTDAELPWHRWTTINWTGNTTHPANYSYDIWFQTRTAPTNITNCPSVMSTNYSDNATYSILNSDITSKDDRCIQYRFVMASNDSTETPAIDSVTIGYKIADRVQIQDSAKSYINLDTYFYDPDTDDEIVYNVTDLNGSDVIGVNVTIDNVTHRVMISTIGSSVGEYPIIFNMYDGYNYTYSNVVYVNVSEPPSQPQVIIVPVGGGGSVSQPVPYEVPKYVSTPVSFRLLTPKLVTTYVNNSMEIPINIFNSNFTMRKLKLKAVTSNENVQLTLDKDYFDEIAPNDKKFVTLRVDSFKTYGAYEILVQATAEATASAEDGTEKTSEFTETAKIFVNSLLKAEGNDTQVNTKLAFAEDLLSTNPECLELNEFLQKARDQLKSNPAEADKTIGQVIDSCKYLLAPKETAPEIEATTKVYGMPTESVFILATVSLVTIIVAISLVFGWAHMKSRRKEALRKGP
ncbi:hypothetical protein KY363_03295 [Candidatus Woesearchaeota archaeon]|nr:hypothetical protein [Candidatus Woesearchaeota archaeon]